MDTRLRAEVRRWLTEAGGLYVLVIVLVGLCFLIKNSQTLLSCNPTFSKKPALEGPPLQYGRTP